MVTLTVEGMTCGGCVRSVTKAIQALDPAARVEVDLSTGHVAVDSAAGVADLESAIVEAGFEVVAGSAG